MKQLLPAILSVSLFLQSSTNHSRADIDPTGTYILKGKTEKNIIKGHNGEIRAKLLSKNKLLLSFYLNNGNPDFESASFVDSFLYADNQIIYHSPIDSDCLINFTFNENSIKTYFIHSDPKCQCGFAKGLIVPTTFEKSSSEIPVFKNR